MLISEIIALAEAQCDETYTKAEWIALYNKCQDDLTPVAKIMSISDEIEVSVSDGKALIVISENTDLLNAHHIFGIYYAPANGKETKLRRLNIHDQYSKGWKLDATKLYLQGLGEEETGSIKVIYYKKLIHCDYVANPESYTPESPEIPSEFHGLYVSYLCAMSQQREEESEDMGIFMAEYNKLKSEFGYDRIKQMEPWNLRNYNFQAQGGE